VADCNTLSLFGDAGVYGCGLFEHARAGEARVYGRPGRLPEFGRERWVRQQFADGAAKGGRVVRGRQKSGFAVGEGIGNAADVGGDDG